VARRRGAVDRIGFGREKKSGQGMDQIAISFTAEEVENIANFQAYGFLPELIARFTRFVPFKALDKGTLKDILRNNVVERLTREFEDEGFKLIIGEDVLDHVVADSLRRETGARGLAAILTRQIEDVAFENFADHPGGEIRLKMQSGEIVTEVA
jgi:ATP-dependent Clp protease ATP-binding subunit ClpX